MRNSFPLSHCARAALKMASDSGRNGSTTKKRRVILVLSGKGGVGKSTVAVQLALGLQHLGNKVGLLDVDLCGPNVPHMLNLGEHRIHSCSEGWVPVFTDPSQTLSVMSIGFLLENKNDAIIWRGPKKTAMIKQFLNDVCWPEIDYLIIDTPPGTSDEHIAVMESVDKSEVDGAVLVTTPERLAIADVRREITFCRKAAISILGLVENKNGYVCPTCEDCAPLFSTGGGAALAEYAKIPFLGKIPIDTRVSECADTGTNYLKEYPNSPVSISIGEIVAKLTSHVHAGS